MKKEEKIKQRIKLLKKILHTTIGEYRLVIYQQIKELEWVLE